MANGHSGAQPHQLSAGSVDGLFRARRGRLRSGSRALSISLRARVLGPGAGRCQALDQLFVEKRRLTTRFSQTNGGKGVVADYGFSVAFGIVCRAINPALGVASDTHHHPGHQRLLEHVVHSDARAARGEIELVTREEALGPTQECPEASGAGIGSATSAVWPGLLACSWGSR